MRSGWTWFGISNFHYQIGELGIMLDGAVGFPARDPNPDVVTKVREALELEGTIDYVLLGHLHSDHSVDTPECSSRLARSSSDQRLPARRRLSTASPPVGCVPSRAARCSSSARTSEMHVVKWVHSVGVGQTSSLSGGIETFGFLLKIQTPSKVLTMYLDSGASGTELVKEHMSMARTAGHR